MKLEKRDFILFYNIIIFTFIYLVGVCAHVCQGACMEVK